MTTTIRLGRCLNAGRCGLAGERGPIPIEPGAAFLCPECKSELIPQQVRSKKVEPGKRQRGAPKMLILPALLLAILIIIGIRYDLFKGLDLTRTPPLDITDTAALAPPDSVRSGSSTITYDELSPAAWHAFLTEKGCTDIKTDVIAGRTIIACKAGLPTTIVIAAPDSVIGVARNATKAQDVLLTTDDRFAGAPRNTERAEPAEDGSIIHAEVIGIDSLSVVVNPANPLSRLSQSQLAAIFLGGVTDFSAVGGRPGRIQVVAPAGNARVVDRLDAIVPQWLPLTPGARRLQTSNAIIQAVIADPNAIGLVDRRHVGGARVVAIGPSNGHAVTPSPLTLVSGDYPLARPVYGVRFNRDDSPFETEFITFLTTAPGQKVVAASGFEPLRHMRIAEKPAASAPAAYRTLVTGSDRMAANLRFRDGTLDLEPRSKTDLATIAARLAGERIATDRIIVIGLSDASRPDPAADSANLARRVATEIGERGIEAPVSHGLGAILPLAEGPGAAARNRRVEIWIRPA